MNPLNLYVNLFTPAGQSFHDGHHPQEKMALLFGFYGVLVALYSFFKWSGLGGTSLAATSALMLLLVLFSGLLLRWQAPTAFSVNVILGGFIIHALNMVYQLGGINSPHIFWLVALIVLVYFMADGRSAFFWSVLLTLVTVWLLYRDASGATMVPVVLEGRAASVDTWSGYLLPLAIVWLAQSISRRVRTEAQRISQEALESAQISTRDSARNAQRLQHVLVQVEQSVDQLRRGGDNLEELQSTVHEQNQHIQEHSQHLADAAVYFTERLSQVSTSLNQGSELVQQMNDTARQAACLSQESGATMEAVVESIRKIKENNDRIEEATRLINDIADQTNLLALNAAIESARAGDAGQGFAVVADEVRKLSQRSDESANEIRKLLSRSIADIDNGVRVVGKARQTLQEVLRSVTAISDTIASVSQQIVHQNQEIADMVQSSRELSSISSQQKVSSLALAQSQQALKQQSRELTQLARDMQAILQMVS
ncbi:chemotaxis sensory transducer [Desulfurispirillum indicum S5]|uniref:Chemotaxis sensory transducer n=1 Tax=Desulfurispirillum indicum (strain ATCC BAA-1389 / DSM 22839 / S5) TaxID=653733 RepID=E6W690_DESIS|nr:methyl-accepting chemotaxis protein [Desulfurispirillum indicum]ADU66126.1 chemotaxis sensory transducer [Desulfurispirillum indicum S5]